MKKILLLLFFMSSLSVAQSDTIKITPNKNYDAGPVYRWFFGDHWRDLWTTPVSVPVIDITTWKGGIVPVRRGGGMQTKSLRFQDKNGNLWKFRSVDKDPSKMLPDEVKKTVVDDMLQDQISSANPFGALVVTEFMQVLDIYHAEPYIYYLPKTNRLGEFNDEFGGTLGLLEIHPDEDGELSKKLYGNTDKISGTIKVYQAMEEKRSNKVDGTAFLKARLLDIFINDWDRHVDQWRWARFKEGDKKIWRPIPRDRDQAFVKYSGILPGFVETLVPQLNHFSEDYTLLLNITWNGRFVDRRFLNEVTRAEWDSVTAQVVTKITDEVIEKAVKRLPPEHYEIAGEEMVRILKVRRNKLAETSDKYYELINYVIDFYASNNNDYCIVDRLNDNQTLVQIFKRDKKSGGKKGKPYVSRLLDNNTTREIRVHMGGGNDYGIIRGIVNESPLVRMIGGDGKDEIIDDSAVNGKIIPLLPLTYNRPKARFYDSDPGTKLKMNFSTRFDDHHFEVPEDEVKRYETEVPDRGTNLMWLPELGISGGEGLIMGVAGYYDQYNFRANPSEYRIKFFGKYATKPQSFHVGVNSIFYELMKGNEFYFDVEYNQLRFNNYFGYGNENDYDEELEEEGFYNVETAYYLIQGGARLPITNNLRFDTKVAVEFNDVDITKVKLLKDFPQGEYGLGENFLLGVSGNFEFDTRDDSHLAYSGFYANVGLSAYPKVGFIKETFVKGSFDIRGYIPVEKDRFAIALRAGGEGIAGKYPFYMGAIIGSKRNLRGVPRERYIGDASLYFQTEARGILTDIHFVIKGKLGLIGFTEVGRVFTEPGNSKRWHPSYGGGFYVSFLERVAVVRLTVGLSDDEIQGHLSTGMAF